MRSPECRDRRCAVQAACIAPVPGLACMRLFGTTVLQGIASTWLRGQQASGCVRAEAVVPRQLSCRRHNAASDIRMNTAGNNRWGNAPVSSLTASSPGIAVWGNDLAEVPEWERVAAQSLKRVGICWTIPCRRSVLAETVVDEKLKKVVRW